MSNIIRHNGIIDSVAEGMVKVRILQTSACAACSLAKHCNSAESKEKIIDVACESTRYRVGQQVVVSVAASMGYRAVLLGFGLPFGVLVAVIVLAFALTSDEPFAALLGIASLIPYSILLYLCRDRISRTLSFGIE